VGQQETAIIIGTDASANDVGKQETMNGALLKTHGLMNIIFMGGERVQDVEHVDKRK